MTEAFYCVGPMDRASSATVAKYVFARQPKSSFPSFYGRELTPRVQGKRPVDKVPDLRNWWLIVAFLKRLRFHSIVFLNRQPSAVAELLPLPPGTAIRRFGDFLSVDAVRDLQLANLQKLSSIDVMHELRYRTFSPRSIGFDLLARGIGTLVV